MKPASQRTNWISPEEAVQKSIDSMERAEVKNSLHLVCEIQESAPSTPFFVRFLLKESGYYLVPWICKKKVGFLIQINAETGEFEAISFFKNMRKSPVISPKSALRCAKKVFPDESFVEKGLVWTPCRESTTPTSPFYLFESSNLVVFVDMDCRTFRSLTPLGKGS